jgi:DNA-binding FadR family transcriptional regulator
MPEAIRPLVRRRLHEDVAEHLRDAILDGRFKAGDKLPPERELAARFGVNRTSVREALKVLEGLRMVRVRQGDGAIVLPVIDASLDLLGPMLFHDDRLDAALLAELREVLGPLLFEMARLALERSGPAHVDAIRALRDRLADPARELEERAGAARDLLVLLADMTGNRVWQMLARRTRAFLASAPLREARRRLARDPAAFVPAVDAGLAALAEGRTNDAIAAVQRFITLLGATGESQ